MKIKAGLKNLNGELARHWRIVNQYAFGQGSVTQSEAESSSLDLIRLSIKIADEIRNMIGA